MKNGLAGFHLRTNLFLGGPAAFFVVTWLL